MVKLVCLQGQEYAGNLSPDQKSAEKSAAQQALIANDSLVQEVKLRGPNEKKRNADLTPAERAEKKARMEAAAASGNGNPAITPKTEINSLVMRIVKRYLQKGETIYVCNKIGNSNQFQATVQISGLPDHWGQRAWAGQVCNTKQLAEQSAAEQALVDIKADATLMEEANKPKGGGKGKGGAGKGKGKGKGGGNWWGNMAQMMESMWSMWEEGNKRERVGEADFVGSVKEWKGTFGWLQTSSEIDHPAKNRRGGKIYIHKNDIQDCPETLGEGQQIKFKLYADSSGLGAEEASVV